MASSAGGTLAKGGWLFKRSDLDLSTLQQEIEATKRHKTTLAGQDRSQLDLELSQT